MRLRGGAVPRRSFFSPPSRHTARRPCTGSLPDGGGVNVCHRPWTRRALLFPRLPPLAIDPAAGPMPRAPQRALSGPRTLGIYRAAQATLFLHARAMHMKRATARSSGPYRHPSSRPSLVPRRISSRSWRHRRSASLTLRSPSCFASRGPCRRAHRNTSPNGLTATDGLSPGRCPSLLRPSSPSREDTLYLFNIPAFLSVQQILSTPSCPWPSLCRTTSLKVQRGQLAGSTHSPRVRSSAT